MELFRWVDARDGTLSLDSLRLSLMERGYAVDSRTYELPVGFFQSSHSHGTDRVEAVVSGVLRVRIGSEELVLEAGDALEIPAGTSHTVDVRGEASAVCLDASRKAPPTLPNKPLRLLVLAGLLLLLNSWAVKHLELDWWKLAVVNLFAVILPQFQWFLDDATTKSLKELLNKGLRLLLGSGGLFLLGGVTLLLTSCWSTVTVSGGSWSEPRAVYVHALNERAAAGDTPAPPMPAGQLEIGRPVRKLLGTNPLGREYRLELEGYLDYDFVLSPWFGRRIRVETDLTRRPTILIRIPPDLVGPGCLRLSSRGQLVAAAPTSQSVGGLLVGDDATIPDANVAAWERHLRSLSRDEPAEASTTQAWLNSPLVPPAIEVSLPSTFVAEYVNQAGLVAASREFEVAGGGLQDLLLKRETTRRTGTACE